MTEKKIITPTVGRKVWFRPNGTTKLQVQNMPSVHLGPLSLMDAVSPLDATVVYVWDERTVNLSVQDHYGQSFLATSVPLVQEGDAIPGGGFYCEWMPYQVRQAKKDQEPPVNEKASATSNATFVSKGELEELIKAAGADKAPRVTPAALKDEIVSAHYFTAGQGWSGANFGDRNPPAPLNLLTFCVLVLRNGFTVHGVSACASPENYNREIGERIARENAERAIWPLLGFRLRDELASKA